VFVIIGDLLSHVTTSLPVFGNLLRNDSLLLWSSIKHIPVKNICIMILTKITVLSHI